MEASFAILGYCLALALISFLCAGVEGRLRHELGFKYRRSSRTVPYKLDDSRKAPRGPDARRSARDRSIPPRIEYLLGIDYESALLDYIKHIHNLGIQGNCTLTSLSRFTYDFPQSTYDRFSKQMNEAVNTASFIGGVFQTTKAAKTRREKEEMKKGKKRDIRFNDGFYYSLVKWVAESDSLIYGCAIGFDEELYRRRYNDKPTSFCPYAYKNPKTGKTIVKDLSRELNYHHNLTTGCEWYREQKYRNFSHLFAQNITKYPFYSESVGDLLDNVSVISATRKEGLWSPPYFDCDKGANWLVTYSVPFFDVGHKFVGVVAIDIDLKNLDINQCSKKGLFSDTHKCSLETTQCKHVPGNGFHRGSYRCYCKDGFYFPPDSEGLDYFNGSVLEEQFIIRNEDNSAGSSQENSQCLPCARGCRTCQNSTPCFVEYDVLLRGIPLGIQSFCMTITLVLGFILIRLRRNRVMKSSMWVMLEILLFGALLLYSTVVIQYFEPNTTTCLLIPWFREVGFAIVYGALILKVYRVLAEFQSRKAHRVHVRDKDLLKYLLGIALIVIGYMSAWTAVNMDHVRENVSLLDMGVTGNTKYYICKSHWWDYVIEIGEFLFLCLGIYLCYCVRSAPSEYGEIRYISWAIYNETVISTILYVLRHFLWLQVNPDYIFLMYFIRCQLTVTVTLILVLGPKLWYAHRPPDEDSFRTRAFSTSDVHDTILPESMKLHVGISSNGDVDVGEINLAEMDPEDIRAELKRLYTQLQIYKTKTMRKDNPHISKRKGGRKQTHRRFSLQPFHKHHRGHHHHDEHEHELSKTPEESTNSAEGVAITLDGSSRAEEGHVLPSVTFKTGHK